MWKNKEFVCEPCMNKYAFLYSVIYYILLLFAET